MHPCIKLLSVAAEKIASVNRIMESEGIIPEIEYAGISDTKSDYIILHTATRKGFQLNWSLSLLIPSPEEQKEIDSGDATWEEIEEDRVLCIVNLLRVGADGTERIELDLSYHPDIDLWYIEHKDVLDSLLSLDERVIRSLLDRDREVKDKEAFEFVRAMCKIFNSEGKKTEN